MKTSGKRAGLVTVVINERCGWASVQIEHLVNIA